VKTAQARLGHADVRTTLQLYALATSAADRLAAEVLDRRFADVLRAFDLDHRAKPDSPARWTQGPEAAERPVRPSTR
jgi:integrase